MGTFSVSFPNNPYGIVLDDKRNGMCNMLHKEICIYDSLFRIVKAKNTDKNKGFYANQLLHVDPGKTVITNTSFILLIGSIFIPDLRRLF